MVFLVTWYSAFATRRRLRNSPNCSTVMPWYSVTMTNGEPPTCFFKSSTISCFSGLMKVLASAQARRKLMVINLDPRAHRARQRTRLNKMPLCGRRFRMHHRVDDRLGIFLNRFAFKRKFAEGHMQVGCFVHFEFDP